ncbi:hypothetical protein [Tahibacter soli]|uniref:Uncharacterized protein n=1 Tax=Tahibacter soli TaxID=2983605 RepID=A0A9X4BN04_9GAMM|nr:hypothetical protein [Tahibacter soli]MDC8015839.1 hypothetical protein [Tahibacter soli]
MTASACPACGHLLPTRAKLATVLLGTRATCGWCGVRCRVAPWLNSAVALVQIALLFFWAAEYAMNRGNFLFVAFLLFTAAAMYSMVRFAPLKRAG